MIAEVLKCLDTYKRRLEKSDWSLNPRLHRIPGTFHSYWRNHSLIDHADFLSLSILGHVEKRHRVRSLHHPISKRLLVFFFIFIFALFWCTLCCSNSSPVVFETRDMASASMFLFMVSIISFTQVCYWIHVLIFLPRKMIFTMSRSFLFPKCITSRKYSLNKVQNKSACKLKKSEVTKG